MKNHMTNDFQKNWLLFFEDNSFIKVDLPYDAMIHEKRFKSCASGDASSFFPGHKYIYQKEFELKKKDNHYFAIFFESSYRNTKVIINEQELFFNKYGFSSFLVDFSNVALDGKNVLRVEIDNSLVPNARFYTGSGIFRPVSLIVKKENEIKKIKIKTINYKDRMIDVEIDSQKDINIKIYDRENKLVYDGNPGQINIKNGVLWDEDNPYLYRLEAKSENDYEETLFGIRQIELISKKGLIINGKETLLRGACLHSDNGILGAASYKDFEFMKIKSLKEAGFNAIRSAHNPCSRYILEACDFYGVFVIDEVYDGWYVPKNYHDHARDFSVVEAEKDIKSMVDKDFNHPSVIMYSLGNEVSEVTYKKGLETLEKMYDFIKDLDNTRPVTLGANLLICVYEKLGIGVNKDTGKYVKEPLKNNSKHKEKKSGSNFFNYLTQKIGDILFVVSKSRMADKIAKNISSRIDVLGLNYGTSRYEIDSKKYPDRLMLGTETFIKDLPYNWAKVKSIPNLIGDFIWVGYDFLGEASFGAWLYYSYQGLPLTYGLGCFDILGNKTALMSFMQCVWDENKKPVIAIRPLNHYNENPHKSAWRFTNAIENYNFHGYENKRMTVEVYSSQKYISLYQNDKLVRTKKIKNNKTIFKCKYILGSLKAVALNEKKENIAETVIFSGDNKPHIDVKLSKNNLSLSSDDIIFVNVEIHNDLEQLLPCYEGKITLELSDNLSLIAFGSGLSNNKEDYNSFSHHAYQGQVAFAIKANGLGAGKVVINGQDLCPKTIKIKVEE